MVRVCTRHESAVARPTTKVVFEAVVSEAKIGPRVAKVHPACAWNPLRWGLGPPPCGCATFGFEPRELHFSGLFAGVRYTNGTLPRTTQKQTTSSFSYGPLDRAIILTYKNRFLIYETIFLTYEKRFSGLCQQFF